MIQDYYRRDSRGGRGDDDTAFWIAVGAGVLAGAAGLAFYQRQTRNRVEYRPPDDAPARTSRVSGPKRHVHTGRTVTIGKPRDEIYRFWRDFSNLPQFMENVRSVETSGDRTRWTIAGPMGRDVRLVTRITEDREGERIAWASTDESEIETTGSVDFRDAPAERGTQVAVDIAYRPPGGELGRWVAKALQAEPHLQARRDLKRLKMLLEAGEIATSANRKSAA